MSKDKASNHNRTDRVSKTPGREHLTGASPVGNRWRAQGHINGSVRYLGTFDTEQEAHACYTEAKSAERDQRDQDEAAWAASAPEYLYTGGIGRGARLNGTRYKLVSESLANHLILRQIGADGTLATDMVTLNRRYLKIIEDGEGTPKETQLPKKTQTDIVAVDPLTENPDEVLSALHIIEGLVKEEALSPLVSGSLKVAQELLQKSTQEAREASEARKVLKNNLIELIFPGSTPVGMPKKINFLLEHLQEDVPKTALLLVEGKLNHAEGFHFLEKHTQIPRDIINEVFTETVGQIFTRPEDPSPELVARVNKT